jgi:cleavage and polyadenylation specificity factor subunit 1
MSAHHPVANRLVEHFHQTMKAAIMCHADQNLTEALSLVLFVIHTAFKEDLQASVVDLMYGELLRIPGDLLTLTADPVDPAYFIIELHQFMACLRPVPASCHASPATFMHSDPKKCTHVFLYQDTTCWALETPVQRHLPGPVTEREHTATPHVREAHHGVNQPGHAGLRPQWD